MKTICQHCKRLIEFEPAETQIETCQVCGEYFIIDVSDAGYTARITVRKLPEISPEEIESAEKRYYLNRLEEIAA